MDTVNQTTHSIDSMRADYLKLSDEDRALYLADLMSTLTPKEHRAVARQLKTLPTLSEQTFAETQPTLISRLVAHLRSAKTAKYIAAAVIPAAMIIPLSGCVDTQAPVDPSVTTVPATAKPTAAPKPQKDQVNLAQVMAKDDSFAFADDDMNNFTGYFAKNMEKIGLKLYAEAGFEKIYRGYTYDGQSIFNNISYNDGELRANIKVEVFNLELKKRITYDTTVNISLSKTNQGILDTYMADGRYDKALESIFHVLNNAKIDKTKVTKIDAKQAQMRNVKDWDITIRPTLMQYIDRYNDRNTHENFILINGNWYAIYNLQNSEELHIPVDLTFSEEGTTFTISPDHNIVINLLNSASMEDYICGRIPQLNR